MRIAGPTVRLAWWAVILIVLTKLIGWLLLRTVLTVKRHPDLTAALAASAGLWWLWTKHPASYPATGAALAVAFLWSTCWPRSFDACIGNRLRARWRRLVYKRNWQPACAVTGLATDTAAGQLPPRLIRVRSHGPTLDVITTEADPPTPDAWRRAAPDLARILGVHTIRVRPDRRGRVSLWAYRADPLFQPVEPLACADSLERVPVGVREDGRLFHLPVLYSHTLIAGETGAGKGSVLWSCILGLAPHIHDGTVQVWAIDPKGGAELSAGGQLFADFTYGRDPGDGRPWQTDIAEALEDAAASMRARLDTMRQAEIRKHAPSRDQPAIVIVIDELAALVAYVTDPQLRRRITDALSLLLSQGRAAAVSVIAATQDARKETIGLRDLFPTRVALRAAEPQQADMVLGRDARNRGAHTDRISRDTPGVGYVSLEGEPDPVRVRFSHITDEHIADTAARHAPPARTETAA